MTKLEWRAIQLVLKGFHSSSHCFGTRMEALNGGLDPFEMSLDEAAINLALEKGWLRRTSDNIVKFDWNGGGELERLAILKERTLTAMGESIWDLTNVCTEFNEVRVRIVKEQMSPEGLYYLICAIRLKAIDLINDVLGDTQAQLLTEELKAPSIGSTVDSYDINLKNYKNSVDKYFDVFKRHFARKTQGANVFKLIALADTDKHRSELKSWESEHEERVEIALFQLTGEIRPDLRLAKWMTGQEALLDSSAHGIVVPSSMSLRRDVLFQLFTLLEDHKLLLFTTDNGDKPYVTEEFDDLVQTPTTAGAINIANLTVHGVMNTGTARDIQQITQNTQIMKASEPELAEYLDVLTKAIDVSVLPESEKVAVLDRVEELTDEASKPAEIRKPKRLKERMDNLTQTLNDTKNLGTAAKEVYQQFEPMMQPIAQIIAAMVASQG